MPASALAETPQLFPHQDKVLHALMYGGWAILLAWTLQRQWRRQPVTWINGMILVITAYGALMEVLQGSLPWIQRTCSWGDVLANVAGVVLGVGLYVLYARARLCRADICAELNG